MSVNCRQRAAGSSLVAMRFVRLGTLAFWMVVPDSAGGGYDLENLVSLCAAHHLHSVHMGFIRVRGKAPDRLRTGA